METINDRIRFLRKNELGLTLEKFGKPLGIQNSAVSKMEKGRTNITEQMIKSICNVDWDGKIVNEQWLRTGEGSIFEEIPPEDEFLKAAAQLSSDSDIRSILISYWKQDEAGKQAIKKFIHDIFTEKQKND